MLVTFQMNDGRGQLTGQVNRVQVLDLIDIQPSYKTALGGKGILFGVCLKREESVESITITVGSKTWPVLAYIPQGGGPTLWAVWMVPGYLAVLLIFLCVKGWQCESIVDELIESFHDANITAEMLLPYIKVPAPGASDEEIAKK